MTLLLVLVFVVNEAIKLGLPFQHAIWLVPYTLPEQLRLSIPMTLLLATTVSFSRMAGNNEMIAVKSLGISPLQLMWPVWILALMFSLFCVWLNDYAVTWGRSHLTSVVYRALEDMIYAKLARDGEFEKEFGDDTYTIRVDRVDGKKLILPEIVSHKKQWRVRMEEAEIQVDYDKAILTIAFTNLIMSTGNDNFFYHERSFSIPIPNPENISLDYISPSEVPMSAIEEQIRKCNAKIEAAQRKMASLTAFSLVTGDSNLAASQAWQMCEHEVVHANERLRRLRTESPRRWANGFSCFFFVWLGVPLAIRLQRADVFSSFFACFLPILALYYPILIGGVNSAKSGTLPPSFVWVGNIILGIIGYWFVKQIHKN
ncbi:MAG: LptF/LptG family permease [Planctomycetaceae bacterium]|nr:LptF/LptG family permease [Planctomycetaceae bacterium]